MAGVHGISQRCATHTNGLGGPPQNAWAGCHTTEQGSVQAVTADHHLKEQGGSSIGEDDEGTLWGYDCDRLLRRKWPGFTHAVCSSRIPLIDEAQGMPF